jgi:hypothetical protein
MIGQPLTYKTQLIYSWLAFLVENQVSVNHISSVVLPINSLDVPLHGGASDPLELRFAGPSPNKT